MEERGNLTGLSNSSHKITTSNRKAAAITGVRDVLAFDLNEVLLETDHGMLMIKGSDLHVKRLSLEKGEVDIDGSIDSFLYSDVAGHSKQQESLLGRLFR